MALRGALLVYQMTPIIAMQQEVVIPLIEIALDYRLALLAAHLKKLDRRYLLVSRTI